MSIKIDIAIATAGRREVLSETISVLAQQSRIADELLICPAKDEDLDLTCLNDYPGKFRVCRGPVGLTSQRNTLIASSKSDVLVFFDDDFLPSGDYVQEIEALFVAHPEIVAATGKVLADGITGPGLDYVEGMKILESAGRNMESSLPASAYNGYGCNMAFRMQPIREHEMKFDERLPLYGWLEDVDFSRQIAPHGKIVKVARLRGVHLGTKRSGRSPGKRLGYSQVANPVYLVRKGTMHWKRALIQITRNLIANSLRSLLPEPWVDRRGRLSGNLHGLYDLFLGVSSPEKALKV